MLVFALVLQATAFLLVAIAAFEDVRHMRIRNDLSVGVAILFIPYAFTLGAHDALVHIGCAAIVLAITATLFFTKMFGGGDAKMLAALALWLDFGSLPLFAVTMAMAGGALALTALLFKQSQILSRVAPRFPAFIGPHDGWLASLARGEAVVPYGVAIAVATAVTFSMTALPVKG